MFESTTGCLHNDTVAEDQLSMSYENDVPLSPSEVALLEMFDIPMPIHIICVSLIIIFSLCGNSLVIHLYAKAKPFNVGNIYILFLATLDITASIVISPQLAMIHYSIERSFYNDYWRRKMMFYPLQTVLILYLEILVTIALDRVYAVFAPYSYKQTKRRILAIIGLEMCISLFLTVVLGEINDMGYGRYRQTAIGVFIFASFVTLAASYIGIIFRLHENKRKVGVKLYDRNTNGSSKIEHSR